MTEIEILHVPHCPNLDQARSRLERALDAVGMPSEVRETEVATADAAERLGMYGSPTILINGRDPFARHGNAASMACRLYNHGGRIDGAPSVEQLADVLAAEGST